MAVKQRTGTRTRLHERLRHETRDLHDNLEAAVDAERQTTSRGSYADYLRRLWRLHRSAENNLCRRDFSAFGFSYDARRRSPLLEADLATLGVSLSANDRTALPSMPAFATAASALGAVYVIEGSALGARVLLPLINASLGLDASRGAAFFAGRPAEDKSMWRTILAALDAIDPDDAAAGDVIAGAQAMFALYLRELPEVAQKRERAATP